MGRKTSWLCFVAVVGVALLVITLGSTGPEVWADPRGYEFTPLVFLGDSAPGGGVFLDVFESNVINNRGDVLFGSNMAPGDPPNQGLFLLRKGEIGEIARAGDLAPGGGVYDFGFLSPTTLNDKGDAAFAFLLSPFSFPAGMNAGVFRFSQSTHTVAPVMRPGLTPAPGGGVFKGAQFGVSLNNRGDLVFGGIVETEQGIRLPDEAYIGLGGGLFKASRKGHISRVVTPGDPAPGDGNVFDFAFGPSMNDAGDVTFTGHIAGQECRPPGSLSQEILIGCLGSVYVKRAATGNIRSIAHAGAPAPGGDGKDVYRQAIDPVINNRGDIVFLGDLTSSPDSFQVTGVYLHSAGKIIRVAGPGDPMPGGGRLVTAGTITGWQLDVNNAGDVVFNAQLDTDDNADNHPDTGLYVWSRGALRLVARTDTVVTGVGTIAHLSMNVPTVVEHPVFAPNSGANNNDRGQVLFGATLCDVGTTPCATSEGRGVLLVATPKSHTPDQ